MTFELLIITLLALIFAILFFLLISSSKKNKISENVDLQNIEKHLNSLLHKTIEQSGYINSKIDEIGDLTKKMNNAMTTNISDMGQMGEVILENILQDCGMTKNRDYKTQYTDYNENGQQFRPDVVIFLPENRNIIIDSKVPMKDWYEFQNSESESSKQTSIMNFSNTIKNHINQIKKKDYTKLLSLNSPDYIFIFMPHEFALTTAQKYDTSIASYAQQKNVIIVGPSTLILCMKLVESIWKLEKQNNNSKEIADIAGGLYDQIVKTINLLDKTHSSLSKSLENVEDAKKYIRDGRGSLFSKANKMKELGVNTKEPIK